LGAQHDTAQRFIAAAEVLVVWLARGDGAASAAGIRAAHTLYLAHRVGVDATVSSASAFATDAIDSYHQTTEERQAR
jgi:methyl-accepting chemotaxis protein